MRNYAGSALMLFVTIAAAVGSYTINLKVSGERAAVDALQRRIVADARDMRDLQAELRTRARLPEMQRWNDGVLKMSAPVAGQFLRSPLQLASFGVVAEAPAAAPALRYAVTGPAEAAAAPAIVQTAYAPAASTAPVPGRIEAPAAQARAGAAAPTSPAPTEVARIIRASYPSRTTASQRTAAAPRIAAAPRASAPAGIETVGLRSDSLPAPIDLLPEVGQ